MHAGLLTLEKEDVTGFYFLFKRILRTLKTKTTLTLMGVLTVVMRGEEDEYEDAADANAHTDQLEHKVRQRRLPNKEQFVVPCEMGEYHMGGDRAERLWDALSKIDHSKRKSFCGGFIYAIGHPAFSQEFNSPYIKLCEHF
jgi:hypothetical protein